MDDVIIRSWSHFREQVLKWPIFYSVSGNTAKVYPVFLIISTTVLLIKQWWPAKIINEPCMSSAAANTVELPNERRGSRAFHGAIFTKRSKNFRHHDHNTMYIFEKNSDTSRADKAKFCIRSVLLQYCKVLVSSFLVSCPGIETWRLPTEWPVIFTAAKYLRKHEKQRANNTSNNIN